MDSNRPEILAPAGSPETLIAAVRSGADAIYVGGKSFSARSSAANFSLEELKQAADYCRLAAVKLYLAVNTVISDDEADSFCRYIKETAAIGIDAYIVQDHGCAYLIKKSVPDAVIHASTQMTVHTPFGADLLKSIGYSRVVPSRELSENAVKAICDTGIETEIFVHGALCMSVSGQCYMSAMIGSRSANRGCCGQACRLPFSACGNSENAALSLKDLSLLPVISRAADCGACSFKIEGRMKRPEYVSSAVKALADSLDGLEPDMLTLRKIFSRGGFTDGYFTNDRHDMFGVREKDDVTAAKDIFPKIHENYRFERKSRKIDFHAVIREKQPVVLTAQCGYLTASVTADPPQRAMNRPTDIEMLKKQLSRLGDTVYTVGEITADLDEGLIVTAGKLNELRRNAVEQMNSLIISEERPKRTVTDFSPKIGSPHKRSAGNIPLRVHCFTIPQALAAFDSAEYIIIPEKLADDALLSELDKDKIILSPPRFITDSDKTFKRLGKLREIGFAHLLCHTPDSIEMGKRLGFILHGGFGLNVYNSFAVKALAELGLSDVTVSIESKISQLNALEAEIPFGAVISGRLPLMLTRNCPIKNEIGCGHCKKQITDRTGRAFKVRCSGEYIEILNSDTLYMGDKLSDLSSLSFGIIMLDDETPEQTRSLLSGARPSGSITHGLFYRGI